MEAAYIFCGVETLAYDISPSELYAWNIPKNEARNKQIYDRTKRGQPYGWTYQGPCPECSRLSVVLVTFIKATLAITLGSLYLNLEWCQREGKAKFHYYWREREDGMYVAVGRRQTPSAGHWSVEPNIFEEYALTTRHCIKFFFMDEPWTRPNLRNMEAPEWDGCSTCGPVSPPISSAPLPTTS
jgi:hypothetical protein